LKGRYVLGGSVDRERTKMQDGGHYQYESWTLRNIVNPNLETSTDSGGSSELEKSGGHKLVQIHHQDE
jgi:hypothetical protein